MSSPGLADPSWERRGPAKLTQSLADLGSIAGSSGMSYRALLELGEGGMDRIVLALATGPGGFNKLVVLKVMRAGQDDTEVRRLLLAEARLSARLNHPNVVQVQEVVHAVDCPYLVMEYLDGRPLSELRTNNVLTPGMRMTVISEVLAGLHHAHELTDFDGTPLNIVHRDVSPHNVIVTFDGVVKVLDFGIAKFQHDDSKTETGEVKGKIAYMPPEQLLGEEADRRADIFAVGGLLWEVATGARMWANATTANLMHRLLSGDIPRPSSVAEVDAELERIIVKATAADRRDRYQTALEMREELDAYLDESGQRAALRDVGAALSEAFKLERQERARAIQEALRHNPIPPEDGEQLEVVTLTGSQVGPTSSRRRWLIGAAAGAVLIGGGSLAAFSHGVAGRPAAASVSVAPSAPSHVSFSIHATPAEARVKIDGMVYAQSSVALAPARDDRPHTVEVFADGFVPDTRTVTFDKSLSLEIALRTAAPPVASALPVASAHGPGRIKVASGGYAEHRAAPAASSDNIAGASSPAASSAGPATPDGCAPPYFFDHGIKTYKPQCL